MAKNVAHVDAPPERVFEVLSDPQCYHRWVVGAKEIRGADPGFPAPGTRLHHTVGFGPLTLQDHTTVIDAAPPTGCCSRPRAGRWALRSSSSSSRRRAAARA